jgi:hypothetical protein
MPDNHDQSNSLIGRPEAKKSPLQLTLVVIGIPVVFLAALLTTRILWEETSLTFQQGPQMVGFSLAHGPYAYMLFTPIPFVLWLFVAVVTYFVTLVRKKPRLDLFNYSLIMGLLVLALTMVPPVFWQYSFNSSFARSSHAADLACNAAVEGDSRTVKAYLNHGVSLEAKNYDGATILFCAAAGGRLDLVSSLIARGAQVNATNSYGDSPLTIAIENKHSDVATLLQQHNALAIKGTQGEREAAIEEKVRRDIEQSDQEKPR